LVDNSNAMKIVGAQIASAARKRSIREKRAARKLLAMIRAGSDVRSRKTRRLRGAVRADRYENELKFAIAIDKLLVEL
jgi:hypothetical protein